MNPFVKTREIRFWYTLMGRRHNNYGLLGAMVGCGFHAYIEHMESDDSAEQNPSHFYEPQYSS